MEPQEQSFCETVLEEGVIADDTGSDEAHQDIIKAARASENQDDDYSKQHIRDNKGQWRAQGLTKGPGSDEGPRVWRSISTFRN